MGWRWWGEKDIDVFFWVKTPRECFSSQGSSQVLGPSPAAEALPTAYPSSPRVPSAPKKGLLGCRAVVVAV